MSIPTHNCEDEPTIYPTLNTVKRQHDGARFPLTGTYLDATCGMPATMTSCDS
jgi:hypothetical protein